jgi:hypothetical protein
MTEAFTGQFHPLKGNVLCFDFLQSIRFHSGLVSSLCVGFPFVGFPLMALLRRKFPLSVWLSRLQPSHLQLSYLRMSHRARPGKATFKRIVCLCFGDLKSLG